MTREYRNNNSQVEGTQLLGVTGGILRVEAKGLRFADLTDPDHHLVLGSGGRGCVALVRVHENVERDVGFRSDIVEAVGVERIQVPCLISFGNRTRGVGPRCSQPQGGDVRYGSRQVARRECDMRVGVYPCLWVSRPLPCRIKATVSGRTCVDYLKLSAKSLR